MLCIFEIVIVLFVTQFLLLPPSILIPGQPWSGENWHLNIDYSKLWKCPYFSIHSVFNFSQECFFSFQCRGLGCFQLDLILNMLFSDAVYSLKSIFSSCLLLVYKNVINFCILTLYYIILLVLVVVLKMPWNFLCKQLCNLQTDSFAIPSPALSQLITVTRISSTVLNRSGESRHSCPFFHS